MTLADLIAQLTMLAGLVLASTPEVRHFLADDCTDNNVERLEREEQVAEARAILPLMKKVRVQ